MGSLTATTPKPLLQLGGESLLARQLGRLAAAGIDEVVINLSYRGAQIRAAIGDGSSFGLRVRYSQEPEPPLETAGGIVAALPLLGDAPFLLVNADVVCDFDLGRLTVAAADSDSDSDGDSDGDTNTNTNTDTNTDADTGRAIGAGSKGTLVLVPNPPHHAAGDYALAPDARLTLDQPRYTFSGISRLSPALFAGLAPGRRPLGQVFERAIARGELSGLLHRGLWIDVGTPARLAAAETLLGAG